MSDGSDQIVLSRQYICYSSYSLLVWSMDHLLLKKFPMYHFAVLKPHEQGVESVFHIGQWTQGHFQLRIYGTLCGPLKFPKDHVENHWAILFYFILNKPPIHDSYTVTFVKNPDLTLWTPAKINGLMNLTHKLIFKAWFTWCEVILVPMCVVHWFIFCSALSTCLTFSNTDVS